MPGGWQRIGGPNSNGSCFTFDARKDLRGSVTLPFDEIVLLLGGNSLRLSQQD